MPKRVVFLKDPVYGIDYYTTWISNDVRVVTIFKDIRVVAGLTIHPGTYLHIRKTSHKWYRLHPRGAILSKVQPVHRRNSLSAIYKLVNPETEI